jgi:hypothetical protein
MSNQPAFTALRLVRSATIELAAAPQMVFPLFEPLGERTWAEGWEPEMLYPPSGGAEEGMVFSTRQHSAAPTIWAIVRYEPERHAICYLRVAPDSHVADMRVVCTSSGDDRTHAAITYVFTGLSEAGNAYVATFTEEHYQHWMRSWETAINHYLLHGVQQHREHD